MPSGTGSSFAARHVLPPSADTSTRMISLPPPASAYPDTATLPASAETVLPGAGARIALVTGISWMAGAFDQSRWSQSSSAHHTRDPLNTTAHLHATAAACHSRGAPPMVCHRHQEAQCRASTRHRNTGLHPCPTSCSPGSRTPTRLPAHPFSRMAKEEQNLEARCRARDDA